MILRAGMHGSVGWHQVFRSTLILTDTDGWINPDGIE